jgi:pimeloyl-ACP methyl ester carboxylesterase
MARVQANDITINAIKLGEGLSGPLPPVVFVHGLIMDNLSSYYYTVAPAISTETEVVLYDLRGHGLTDRPATGYTLDDALDDLEGLLAALHVPTPVVLVGNSVGGTIALHAAITRPELVAGIGLIEAHPVVEGWGDHLMADIEELVAGFDEPGVREFITGEGGRKLKRMAGVCEDMVTRTSLPADLRAATVMDAELLGRIRCPALLLYGEASDILDRAELLAAEIPGAELRIVDGCSHSVLMEAPEEIGEQLHEWLGSLPLASA